MTIEFGAAADPALRARLGWTTAQDALLDTRGVTVRCTPRRRTVLHADVFKKLRLRGPRAARAEWRMLHELRTLGFRVPDPVCLAIANGDSLVVTRAVLGVPGDAWLARSEANARAACASIAPLVRRLHDAGLCFRDLYWNHVIVTDAGPVLIDVERAFRPRWRMHRWIVKDLAGLAASLPAHAASRATTLRFLRTYQGGQLARDWQPFARAILAKATRIRAHTPKYG